MGSGRGGALSLHQGFRTPGAQPRLAAKQPRGRGHELLPRDVKDAFPPQRPSPGWSRPGLPFARGLGGCAY